MATFAATDLVRAFQEGRGMEVPLGSEETEEMHHHLGTVGGYLARFSVDPSFTWTPDTSRPTRQACWVVSENAARDTFMADSTRLAEFDHDEVGGQKGLQALDNPAFRESLLFLKSRTDQAIGAAATAIGIQQLFQKGWTRYRISRYSGAAGGIGAHFDTNPLTALATNAPGLREIRRDGTIYHVNPNAISIMSGYLLHVATASGERPSLPTLHDVKRGDPEVPKVTVAAFWNFPSRTDIPGNQLGSDLYYDSSLVPPDTGPDGPLHGQWRTIAQAHGKTIVELASSQFE